MLVSTVYSQHRKGDTKKPDRRPIYFEVHLFPSDTLYKCFISYKIPYSNLLFVRDGNAFTSGMNISFEIINNDKVVKRFFTSEAVTEKLYKNTLSNKKYLEGVKSLFLNSGRYKLFSTVTLINTDIEFNVPPVQIIADSNNLFNPIVVYEKSHCDSGGLRLSNFQNYIPFSKSEYSLLIPSNSSNIKVFVEQDKRNVLEVQLSNPVTFSNTIEKCNDEIIIPKGNDRKYFILKGINKSLLEGAVTLLVEENNKTKRFPLNVVWEDKPKSLMNIEDAIESMRLINLNNAADSLEDFPENEAYKKLFAFWRKFDDEPETAFNEVFNEFYTRIDYIRKNFNSLNKQDALKTDRGKTYLIYGKPSKIEREYSDVYNIVEVWTYNSIGEKIYFADKTGRGNFKRIK